MSVSNGQRGNAAVLNAAFVSKTATSSNTVTGVISLQNSSDPNSGLTFTNLQRYINEIADSDGTVGQADSTRKAYANNNIVADGDSRKVAIEKIDAQFDPDSTDPDLQNLVEIRGSGGEVFRGYAQIQGDGYPIIFNYNESTKVIEARSQAFPIAKYLGGNQTLTDNTTAWTFLFASLASATIGYVITIAIKRGSNYLGGTIVVVSDGTNGGTQLQQSFNEVGDCGVTFQADIQTLGGFDAIVLSYKTTSTGTNGKATLEVKTLTTPV